MSEKIDPNKMEEYDGMDQANADNTSIILGYQIDVGTFALRCVKCKEFIPLGECGNCTGKRYRPAYATDGTRGIFCMECNSGMTRWTCPHCETSNPMIDKTIWRVKKGGGCFVATACYGNYDAPEVMVLRQFRDEVLLKNPIGKIFTWIYYAVSPPIANFIASHEYLKILVRSALIAPSVNWATKRIKAIEYKG